MRDDFYLGRLFDALGIKEPVAIDAYMPDGLRSVHTNGEVKRDMTDIIKASPADAGCYVDGRWGQYGTAHMIERAQEFGYSESEVIELAARHLASMGPSTSEGLTTDEYWLLADLGNNVEAWLNENVAPEGYSFGWYEGEFYLWADSQWEDGTY